MATMFKCGQCGRLADASEMVILSEDDYHSYGKPEELARPVLERRVHSCGFTAIRCKAHANAEQLADRAMLRHLRSGGRVKIG